MELKDLEKEIENIKERNKRVELDKRWETSWTRKICICVLTYIVVIIYSYVIRKYDNSEKMEEIIGFYFKCIALRTM